MGITNTSNTTHEKTLICDICGEKVKLQSFSESDLSRQEREFQSSVREKYFFRVTSSITLVISCYDFRQCICVGCLKEQINKIFEKEWMLSSHKISGSTVACYDVNYKERKKRRRERMKEAVKNEKVRSRSELLDLET